MDRRVAMAWMAAGAAAALAGRARGAGMPRGTGRVHEWKEAGRSGVWYAEGSGGMGGTGGTMVLVGPRGSERGSILIDTQTVVFGAQVRREAEEIAGALGLVVNTHHHAEVTGGNRALVMDVRVIAEARCRARIEGQVNRYISQVKEFLHRPEEPAGSEAMEAVKRDWMELHKQYAKFKPEEFAPNETVAEDRTELTVGGRRVVLLRIGGGQGAHTDNDLLVHLPDDDVVAVGGLVSAGRHVVFERDSGASVRGWIDALERLIQMVGEKTVVIPGEGAPGGVELVHRQLEYMQGVRRAVNEAIDAGMARAKVRELRVRLPVPADASHARLRASLGEVYDELKAERQATPGRPKGP